MGENEAYQDRIDHIMNAAFAAHQLFIEKDESLLIIPFTSIKYIEVSPLPARLPAHTIRGPDIAVSGDPNGRYNTLPAHHGVTGWIFPPVRRPCVTC